MPTILIKKSDTPGSVPGTANLTNLAGGAEVAVNTADRRMFTMNSSSAVVEVGTNPSSLTCADGSFTLLKAASASITNLTATSLVLSNLSIASANVTTLTSASATITNLLATTLTISSGTANGVLYLNGSKVATSGSALTFDGTNLGVGVNSRSVAGYSSFGVNGSSGSLIDLYTGGTRVATFGADTTVAFGSVTNIPVLFTINNSEQMRLTSTGLGIGTSSPGAKLVTAINSANTNTVTYLTLRNLANGYGSWGFQKQSSNDLVLANMADGSDVPNTNIAYFSYAGNLGLGVTPGTWWASSKVFQIGAGAALWGQTDARYTYLTSNTRFDGSDYRYIATGAAAQYVQEAGVHNWYSQASGTGGNTFTQGSAKMTLDASGRLGIGTTSPSYKLDVNNTDGVSAAARINGNDQANVRLRLENGGSGGRTWEIVGGLPGANNANFSIRDVTGSTTPLTLDASGNLGIGTSSPSQLVEAVKSSTGDVAYQVTNANTGSAATAQFFASNGTTRTQFFHTGTNYVGTGVLNAAGVGGIYNSTASGISLAADNAAGTIKFAAGGTTERARITSGGDFKWSDNGASGDGAMIWVRNGGDGTANSGRLALAFNTVNWTPGSTPDTLRWDGNTGRLTILTSAKKYKRNITPVTDQQLDKALKLEPSYYQRLEHEYWEYGFIADQADEIGLSEIVSRVNGEINGLDYEKIGVFAIGLIKRHQKTLEQQQAIIEELKAKVAALEAK